MKVFWPALMLVAMFSCASNSTTSGEYAWQKADSKLPEFDIHYWYGRNGFCQVFLKNDGTAVRFMVINPDWPNGMLTYSVNMSIESGEMEVVYSHSITPDWGRDKGYPDYPFASERYDVFYSTCFKAAQSLPEAVQKFLRMYMTERYLNYLHQRKEGKDLMTRRNARHHLLVM